MQIKFKLHQAAVDDRPSVDWLKHAPLLSPDVKEAVEASGFDPAATESYNFWTSQRNVGFALSRLSRHREEPAVAGRRAVCR